MAPKKPSRDDVIPQSDIDSPAGDMATFEAMLSDDSPMLIGISGPPEDRTAIILDQNGDILRLKQGDRFSNSVVHEIGETQVQLLDDRQQIIALTLPA